MQRTDGARGSRGTAVVLALACAGVAAALDAAGPSGGRGPEGPIDLDAARTLFAQARALSDRDGGALWGRRLYGPIILVDPASRAAVANRADRERHLRRVDDELYAGRLPEQVATGNTTTEWAGRRWTMVLWPLPAAESEAGSLLMHECFHRIQPDLGIPLAVPDNHHLDRADGRIWLRLEWRALAEALEEEDPLASEALRDALVFRAYRRSLFPGAAAEENALELSEGLAEFTGLRLGGADDATQWKRARAALGQYDRREASLVRSFAYASGPPYGLLLDRAEPRWPRRVRSRTDLGALLARFIRFTPPDDLAPEAHRRAAMHGYDALAAEERARDTARLGRVLEDRRRFVDDPVLVLDLDGEVRYTFSPYSVRALEGVGTIYQTMRLSAPWGIIEVTDGVLMIEDAPNRRRLVVPAPESAGAVGGEITGPGWTLHLARGWTLADGPRPHDRRVARFR